MDNQISIDELFKVIGIKTTELHLAQAQLAAVGVTMQSIQSGVAAIWDKLSPELQEQANKAAGVDLNTMFKAKEPTPIKAVAEA